MAKSDEALAQLQFPHYNRAAMANKEFRAPAGDGDFDFGLDLTLPEAAFAPFQGKSFEDLLSERSLAEAAPARAEANAAPTPEPAPASQQPQASFRRASSSALDALASLSEEEALALARLAKQHPYAVGWARDFDHASAPLVGAGVSAFSAAGFGASYVDAGLGVYGASLAASGSLGRIERIAAGMESMDGDAQGARPAWLMASPAIAGDYLQRGNLARGHGSILDKSAFKKFAEREASLDALAPKVQAARQAALVKAQAQPGDGASREAEIFDPIAAARKALDAAKAKAAGVLAQRLPKLSGGLSHGHSPAAARMSDKQALQAKLSASESARRRIAASFAALGLSEPGSPVADEKPEQAKPAAPAKPSQTPPSKPAQAPVDAKSALAAVERKDAMGLLKALPEGAPWPSQARWSLAAYCAYHDWPQGLALASQRGHEMDSRGADRLRPLDWALAQKSWRAMAQLWRLGIKPEVNTPAKPSLLSATQAPAQALEAAISAGADVNAPDAQGSRPIHWAAKIGSREICEMLVAAKADLSARDGEARLAREVAKAAKHYELSHYLQREGFRGRAPG